VAKVGVAEAGVAVCCSGTNVGIETLSVARPPLVCLSVYLSLSVSVSVSVCLCVSVGRTVCLGLCVCLWVCGSLPEIDSTSIDSDSILPPPGEEKGSNASTSGLIL